MLMKLVFMAGVCAPCAAVLISASQSSGDFSWDIHSQATPGKA